MSGLPPKADLLSLALDGFSDRENRRSIFLPGVGARGVPPFAETPVPTRVGDIVIRSLMSAFPQKRTKQQAGLYVRFVPEPAVSTRSK
jgi:hypothetical protein